MKTSPHLEFAMFSSLSKTQSDIADEAFAAESGLIYRPISELKGLLVRSRNVSCFAWGLGVISVSLAALHMVGQAGPVGGGANFAGIGGYAGAALFGLAGLGAGLRTTWSRFACLAISAVLLAQSAWYISSPSHWYMNTASAVMFARFLAGWVGMVSFLGTYELFGPHAISPATLKDALEQATDTRMEEAAQIKVQARHVQDSKSTNEPTRAA